MFVDCRPLLGALPLSLINTDDDNNTHNTNNTIGNTINHNDNTSSNINDNNSSSITIITIIINIISNISYPARGGGRSFFVRDKSIDTGTAKGTVSVRLSMYDSHHRS